MSCVIVVEGLSVEVDVVDLPRAADLITVGAPVVGCEANALRPSLCQIAYWC